MSRTLSSIPQNEGPSSVSGTPAQQALARLLQQWPFRALSLGAQLGGTVCPQEEGLGTGSGLMGKNTRSLGLEVGWEFQWAHSLNPVKTMPYGEGMTG